MLIEIKKWSLLLRKNPITEEKKSYVKPSGNHNDILTSKYIVVYTSNRKT